PLDVVEHCALGGGLHEQGAQVDLQGDLVEDPGGPGDLRRLGPLGAHDVDHVAQVCTLGCGERGRDAARPQASHGPGDHSSPPSSRSNAEDCQAVVPPARFSSTVPVSGSVMVGSVATFAAATSSSTVSGSPSRHGAETRMPEPNWRLGAIWKHTITPVSE